MAEVQQMTATEYLALPESDQPMELIEGEIIVAPNPLRIHQRILLRLVTLLQNTISHGEVVLSPQDIRFDDDHVFQPDCFWIRGDEPDCLPLANHWEGPPDLVVEILSPGTAKRDRGIKYDVYERSGVREYWIVDPVNRLLEVYQHDGERLARVGVHDGAFDSPVLGPIDVTNVFQEID